ncbi:hypothetical protein QTP70_033646 [Hemibagrus guttatus]|uniref:Amine oxidase domain-containing protein n=1 Tax=Hemibagrus guttatus TaxID=175788 RepID=A0AAE0Q8Q6_9TELE|nr:hypothetical protein QTP70_033646 [Hemibagrus guttatus]
MQKCVAVLGGGIGGLSACYYLSKSTHVSKVVLLEATGRFGGWINTTRREDGAVFEHGPRGVRPAGAVGRNTLNMWSGENCASIFQSHHPQCDEGGPGEEGERRRMSLFTSFMSRRFGSELADIAMDCLCRGVFAGDSRKLSVRSCFPPLHRAEQDRGSVLLGLLLSGGEKVGAGGTSALARRAKAESWSQWSLTDGMQTLPDALQEVLRGHERVELHHSAPIRTLTYTAGGWEFISHHSLNRLNCRTEQTLNADHVISALPASVLASLLPPAATSLSQLLCEINTVSVGMVNLEYEGSVLPVTVMMGGAWFEETLGPPDEVKDQVLLDRALQAVRSHLNITSSPVWSKAAVLKNCIPQYHLGHWKRLDGDEAETSRNGAVSRVTSGSALMSSVLSHGRLFKNISL